MKKYFLLSIILFTSQVYSESIAKTKIKTAKFVLPGLSGSIPENLSCILKGWEVNDEHVPNRVLFHGPKGTGKTSLAKAIPVHLNIEKDAIFELKASSIVNSMQGSGANVIKTVFNRAKKYGQDNNKKSFIFIDEIDGIGVLKNSNNKEHENAIQELWQQLDGIKDNKNIIFICATNNFKDLNKTFIDRFHRKWGIFEFSNPDNAMREELINYFLNKFNIVGIKKEDITKMVDETDGLSNRDIEDIFLGSIINAKNSQCEVTPSIIYNEITSYKDNQKAIIEKIKEIYGKLRVPLNEIIITCNILLNIYSIFKGTKESNGSNSNNVIFGTVKLNNKGFGLFMQEKLNNS